MPWRLQRFHETGDLHFITFSCHNREPLLSTPTSRDEFLKTLEQMRLWYDFFVTGYVVMPEHVHLLVSEPKTKKLSVILQMLKQKTSRELSPIEGAPFWEPRYYDYNVWSEAKRIEKLRYIHRNPVRRGLVARPEDWHWSSFLHYATGTASIVEVESQWTARKREQSGVVPRITVRSQIPHPVPQETRDESGAPRSRSPRT